MLSRSAISGTTALGGMLLLGAGSANSAGLIPDSPAHWMGAVATVLSFINIAGGFLVSGKMLDLFRRPEDPKEYFEFYALPALVLLGGLGAAAFLDVGNLGFMLKISFLSVKISFLGA